jgi:tellurite resistance protein TerC
VFGGFLVFTGIRMVTSGDKPIDLEKNPLVKFVRKFFPVTQSFMGDNFFVRLDNKLWATPLFIVVILIEGTDLIFAVDSIPAIIAISEDPFIIYTSNSLQFLDFVLCTLH